MISASQAEGLSKDAENIRQVFLRAGATTCAHAMAETIMFVADGRSLMTYRLWNTAKPNVQPIITDFVVAGTKSSYSRTGSISLTPTAGRCVGNYVYTTTLDGTDCADAMLTLHFTPPEWKIEETDGNGDGGKARLVSLDKKDGLVFIFNDMAHGCTMTKRELLNLDLNE